MCKTSKAGRFSNVPRSSSTAASAAATFVACDIDIGVWIRYIWDAHKEQQRHTRKRSDQILRCFKKEDNSQRSSVLSWSCDTKGHAEPCVETYGELDHTSASQPQEMATLCIDDHQSKTEDFGIVGEKVSVCDQIALNWVFLDNHTSVARW